MNEAAPDVDALMALEGLPAAFRETVERLVRPLAARIARARAQAGRPVVIGLCGGQGSGKSTVASFLAAMLEAQGLRPAVLSLDDLYLDREARGRLARTRHPLFATRGPPGAHDVALGLEVLARLTAEGPPREVALPRFDKASDNPQPQGAWPRVVAPVDVVLFEGWFVGARPQPDSELAEPVNALEREADSDGVWRRAVNTALGRDYPVLFERMDLLVLLQAPDFEQVYGWRALQEEKLAARLKAEGRPGETMDADPLRRFIQHYERLTRWILREMPGRADVTARLGPQHEVIEVSGLDDPPRTASPGD